MTTTQQTNQDRARPARPQAVLQVRSSEWRSPHIVRLTVGGPGFVNFKNNDFTDKYAKLIFVDPALGLTPPYDLPALRAGRPPAERPITRTYSVPRVTPEREELELEFVVHGPEGVAAPWAAAARPGDTLTLFGAGGGYAPDPDDDWHLFLGDESALPAIGAALEALPSNARGTAYLEVADEDRLPLQAPEGVRLRWLSRQEPGTAPNLLAEGLAGDPWPQGRVGVFAHGERESMKAVRSLLKTRDLGEGQLSLSAYWAYRRTEDRFQAEKREPVGQV